MKDWKLMPRISTDEMDRAADTLTVEVDGVSKSPLPEVAWTTMFDAAPAAPIDVSSAVDNYVTGAMKRDYPFYTIETCQRLALSAEGRTRREAFVAGVAWVLDIDLPAADFSSITSADAGLVEELRNVLKGGGFRHAVPGAETTYSISGAILRAAISVIENQKNAITDLSGALEPFAEYGAALVQARDVHCATPTIKSDKFRLADFERAATAYADSGAPAS